MKLYNSLTKSLEEFEPINKDLVRIYSCGPTVYDHAHIGNLSSYIYADTLRRVLELNGYKVKHVMNYTDVDDKTIKRSLEKYPDLEPKEALKILTDEYIALFQEDIKKVGIDASKIEFVRATNSIEEMKELITELIDAKIAYVTDDGVYFSIEAYKKSGKTYGQLLNISESNTSSARIDNDEYDKDSVHDFALWKKQKPGEPAWDFEIDGHDLKGRPGWHIECSAMSRSALDVPFDIHTGGIDLIFPHHENEIAQSTGATERKIMAKYFVHNNHLLVDGKKMAKSANNFYTLQDIIDKGYDPLAFRLLVLQSHYRKESNFTWDNLDLAAKRLKDFYEFSDIKHQPELITNVINETSYEGIKTGLLREFNDDLDSYSSLNFLDSYVSHIKSTGYVQDHLQNLLDFISSLTAINLSKRPDIQLEQKEIIKLRYEARKDKNWEESDRLRDVLLSQGIGIRDTENGSIWYRV